MDPTIINIYSATGTDPDFYLLKKTRKSISATLNTIQFNFSSPKKFDTRKIEGDNHEPKKKSPKKSSWMFIPNGADLVNY